MLMIKTANVNLAQGPCFPQNIGSKLFYFAPAPHKYQMTTPLLCNPSLKSYAALFCPRKYFILHNIKQNGDIFHLKRRNSI